jgi:hypothetical protein
MFEMNLSIDAHSTGRIDHLVLGKQNPGIIVNYFLIKNLPGIFMVVHRPNLIVNCHLDVIAQKCPGKRSQINQTLL